MTRWTEAWRPAEILENRPAARGTQLTRLRLPDDLPFPFEPGHVIALRAETGKGFVRHAYTLSFVQPGDRSVTILYRVIPEGRLTPHLARLPTGARVEVQGLHHQPIRQEMDSGAPAFLGVGTGSGAGPLIGFATQALAGGFNRPLGLLLGFREAEDIPLRTQLDRLAQVHPGFQWAPVLSAPSPAWEGLSGRVQDHLPGILAGLPQPHVHLVGNMAMVRTVEAALLRAGWPERRVTHEGFFNWEAQADPDEVSALAQRLPRFQEFQPDTGWILRQGSA